MINRRFVALQTLTVVFAYLPTTVLSRRFVHTLVVGSNAIYHSKDGMAVALLCPSKWDDVLPGPRSL